MKIKKFIRALLNNTRYSFKRFPITLMVSIILVILLIILNENTMENRDLIVRLSMVTGLALPVSIFIQLINERYLKTELSKVFSYLVGGIILILYFIMFLSDLNTIAYGRYIGVVLFFVLGCTYIQRLIDKDNYEGYILTILNGAFITGIYSAVLYLGIVFIIFTLEQLFEINMIDYIYFYIFLIVVFIFGVSMFLSKYPKKNFVDANYPKAFKLLLLYIVIPLISVYTLILYAYFLRIIVTWQWPSGLVSHLVIWYSTVSVFVTFFIVPFLEDNKIAFMFRKYFPMSNIPILVMMFLSIGQRIVQYGFTENRYYIFLLGMWILLIMIHFIIKRPKSSIFIMVSLSAFILISIFGPLSSFNVSMRSQNNRLNELLIKNDILDNEQLTPNKGVLSNDQQEISNILSYFNNNHELSYVESLPDGYNLDNMIDDFGFVYSPGYEGDYLSFYYDHDWTQAIDISKYDYYLAINSWNNRFRVSDLEIHYNNYNYTLNISNGNEDMVLDIKEYVRYIHDELRFKQEYSSDDMTVLIEADYNIKLIFNHISGTQVSNGNDIDLYNTEFILLLDYNN